MIIRSSDLCTSAFEYNFFFKKHDFFLEVSLDFSKALDSFLVESNL